jgi:hypothetical protein
MNKYYEGSIYVNFYLDSAAGIIGPGIAILLYFPCKTRLSYILSISFTLICAAFLFCFQQQYLSPTWIKFAVPDKSPYEPESEQDRQYYMDYAIPFIVFVTKVGINWSF